MSLDPTDPQLLNGVRWITFLWTNFSTIFALAALGVILAWFDIFLYDQPVTRRGWLGSCQEG